MGDEQTPKEEQRRQINERGEHHRRQHVAMDNDNYLFIIGRGDGLEEERKPRGCHGKRVRIIQRPLVTRGTLARS